MAVGTSGGSIFLISPDTMTVYAKLSGAHGKAVTAMLPLASEAPGGPDMLLSASADGTLAGGHARASPLQPCRAGRAAGAGAAAATQSSQRRFGQSAGRGSSPIF